MSTTAASLVWVNESRTVVVWLHADGTMEVATREHRADIWGAPVKVEREL